MDAGGEEEPKDGFWAELGRTVRYAIATNGRAVRLGTLMVAAIVLAHYVR